MGGLGAGGCVVRHAPPRDSGAAHHERGGRRHGCAEDRLGRLGGRGLWFPSTSSGQALRDAGRHTTNRGVTDRLPRRLGCCWSCGSTRAAGDSSRLTTNGVGPAARVRRGLVVRHAERLWGERGRADGMGAPRTARRLGVEVRGSLRQAQGRLSGTRVGTPRTGGDRRTASEAWLLLVVVRHGPSGTAPRLTTNGVGPAARVRGGLRGWVGCWGLCGSTRPAERLWGGSPRTGWGIDRHHGLPRRLGCCWSCGSTRAAGYGAPAHHERGRAGGEGAPRIARGLGAEGCVVRHGPVYPPARLTTNGCSRSTGSG